MCGDRRAIVCAPIPLRSKAVFSAPALVLSRSQDRHRTNEAARTAAFFLQVKRAALPKRIENCLRYGGKDKL